MGENGIKEEEIEGQGRREKATDELQLAPAAQAHGTAGGATPFAESRLWQVVN